MSSFVATAVSSVLILMLTFCSSREQNNSDLFDKAENQGKVSRDLEEASGLAASQTNPGYLWTLNDSGNPAEIFLLNDEAEIVLTCKLKNIKNRDWEDIAVGPGPVKDVSYIYVAEIGDNEAKYEYKYLYRFPEPKLDKEEGKISVDEVDRLVVNLPDGQRDMESIAVDYATGDFYFISKREKEVNVYTVAARLIVESDTLVPKKGISIPYFNTVAADFSMDGHELLLKTYDEIYYWKRDSGHSILQTLLMDPIKLDYKREPQGESIAWTIGGEGFYTLSESVDGERASLYFYRRAK